MIDAVRELMSACWREDGALSADEVSMVLSAAGRDGGLGAARPGEIIASLSESSHANHIHPRLCASTLSLPLTPTDSDTPHP
jgi:hypothetical protein